jgi:hypothetical protein
MLHPLEAGVASVLANTALKDTLSTPATHLAPPLFKQSVITAIRILTRQDTQFLFNGKFVHCDHSVISLISLGCNKYRHGSPLSSSSFSEDSNDCEET